MRQLTDRIEDLYALIVEWSFSFDPDHVTNC